MEPTICFFFLQVQLVEGASGEWIPKMKEQFGVQAFDLVFLDHWKDRYLPDTKLMEASLWSSFSTDPKYSFSCHDASLPFSGVWPSQEWERPVGRQRHLSRSSRLLGICPQQPALWKPVLPVSSGVYQSGGRLGEVRLLRVVFLVMFYMGANQTSVASDSKNGLKSVKSVFVICKLNWN